MGVLSHYKRFRLPQKFRRNRPVQRCQALFALLLGAGRGPRLRAVWMTCSQRLGGSIFVLPSVWFWTVFFQDHRNSRMQRAFPGREDPFPVSRNDSRPGVSKKRTRGERCHKDTHTQYPYFFRWAETLPGERCKRCAICQMLFLFRKYRV